MKLGVIIVLALLVAATVSAQAPTGTIRGVVEDSTGAVIPGGTVELHNLNTGDRRHAMTDQEGHYEFVFLPVGRYRVTATLSGFKNAAQDTVLEVGQVNRINLRLEVGSAEETVNVLGSAPLIQTASSNAGKVIDSRRMVDIPLNSRDIQQLTLLVPGTVMPPGGIQSTSAGNVAGQRSDASDYLIDGSPNNDVRNNQVVLVPNIDTIQEFTFQTNAFSAEYGRASGGVVNIVTRSGGNDYRGTVYDFLRNDMFDARNYFDDPKAPIPPFKRNVFGGVLGGPIVHDRTFFFFSYEGRRQRESVTLRATVPTAEQRQGVFRDAQGKVVTDVSGQVTPVAQRILNLVPQPNFAGAFNWGGAAAKPRDANQITVKLDHNFNNANRLSFSYLYQRDIRDEPATNTNLTGFGDWRQGLRHHSTVTHTSTITSRLLNQAVFAFNLLDGRIYPRELSNPAEFGISNGINDKIGLPTINVVGWFQLGRGQAPTGWRDPKFTIRDVVSYYAGKHSLKAGGEIRTWRNRMYAIDQGTLRFDGTFTGNAMVDFLTGRPATVAAVFGDQTTHLGTDVYSAFFQDDFQMSRKLTLNLGARWEYFTVPKETGGRKFGVFDASAGQLVHRDTPYVTSKRSFAPRVGFAYDPTGTGKAAIRGGYGIFYNQGTVGTARNLALNPPEATSITYRGTTLAQPFAGQGTAAVPSLISITPEWPTSYLHSYNANVQIEVARNLAFDAGYYGSTGRNQEIALEINQATYIPGSSTATNTDSRRPFKGFGSIRVQSPIATSKYDSLQVGLTRRVSKGFSAWGFYVLSRCIDYGSSASSRPQDGTNWQAERGPCNFDARHRVVVSFLWDLPGTYTSRALGFVLAGWQLTGAAQFQSGSPLTVLLSTDNTRTGNRLDRPDLVGDPKVANPSPAQWVNATAFAVPALGQFGNLPRNTIIGPGFSNTDLALMKDFEIGPNRRVQFRFEVYNITNTVNFGSPALTLGAINFGKIAQTRTIRGDAGSSRQLQFGLKFYF